MLHENVISADYPTVLALDLGKTCTGTALFQDGKIISSALEMPEDYEWFFMERLENTIRKMKSKNIAYEYVPFQQGRANEHWHSLHGILKAVAQKHKCTLIPIPQGTWKKHVVGFANFSKPTRKAEKLNYMVIKALAIRAIIVEDHNEADAIGVLLTALETGVVERVGE